MKLDNKGSTIVIVSIIVVSVIMLIVGAYGIFWLYQNYQKNKVTKTTTTNIVENIVENTVNIKKTEPTKVDAVMVEKLDTELFTLLNRDNFAIQINGAIIQRDKTSISSVLDRIENNVTAYSKIAFNNKDFNCNVLRVQSVRNKFVDQIDEMFVNKGAFSSGTFLEMWFQQHPAEVSQFFRDYKRNCSGMYERNGIKLYEMK